jgi:hypothetical protein
MLAGMLLNVIEATLPIDAAVSFAGGNGAIGEVNEAAVLFVEDFDHFRFAQSAGVMRLSAGSGIEGGAIENYAPTISVRLTGNYFGVEFLQEGIVIVKPICDCCFVHQETLKAG